MRPWDGGGPLGVDAGGWSPIVAPSAIPFDPAWQTPVALDDAGIARVVAAFAAAAKRALDVGMQSARDPRGAWLSAARVPVAALEHAHRSLRRLIREPRAIAARGGVGDPRACGRTPLPLFVRISATDWRDDGWTPDDSVALARLLKSDGVDLIDCSSGGVVPGVKIPMGPGYQTGFAERVRREAGIATGSVGLITGAEQADTIIRSGQADVVFLARELLRDPHFPLRAARELRQEIAWAPQYVQGEALDVIPGVARDLQWPRDCNVATRRG